MIVQIFSMKQTNEMFFLKKLEYVFYGLEDRAKVAEQFVNTDL